MRRRHGWKVAVLAATVAVAGVACEDTPAAPPSLTEQAERNASGAGAQGTVATGGDGVILTLPDGWQVRGTDRGEIRAAAEDPRSGQLEVRRIDAERAADELDDQLRPYFSTVADPETIEAEPIEVAGATAAALMSGETEEEFTRGIAARAPDGDVAVVVINGRRDGRSVEEIDQLAGAIFASVQVAEEVDVQSAAPGCCHQLRTVLSV